MYSNIKSCRRNPVNEPNSYSDFFNCSVCVRQGKTLSTVLFSLFLNDLEEFLVSNNTNGIDLSNPTNELLPISRILLLLYTDDTILLTENQQTLQKCINDFMDDCTEWKLNVNIRTSNHYLPVDVGPWDPQRPKMLFMR